ncbi:MAG TPA: serine/threonine-protein kinase, partial [Humisphaera sp.]
MATAGQRVGEYVLVAPIGAGAFGEVWRAEHHGWGGAVVAVKLPTDPGYVRLLQQEAAAVRRLDHPNIVRPLAFDPFAATPYLVTQFVDGPNLRAVLGHGPVPPGEAVAVLRQVLVGLRHAHAVGVVHGDVKPENVLLDARAATPAGRLIPAGLAVAGTVRVTDFGLGTPAFGGGAGVGGAAGQSILFSADAGAGGALAGTARYMAPERLDGAAADVRGDLFACGVMLFELLTGRRPAGLEVPSDLAPGTPAHLDEVYRKAVARREARFASAGAFIAALDARAATPGAWSRLRPAFTPTGVGIAFVVFVLVFGARALWRSIAGPA